MNSLDISEVAISFNLQLYSAGTIVFLRVSGLRIANHLIRMRFFNLVIFSCFFFSSVCLADTTTDVPRVVSLLFKVLGIKDVDLTSCMNDVKGADISLKNFASAVETKNYKSAVGFLSTGISQISSSVTDCGVKEINLKLDSLAIAVKFAKIDTSGLDKAVDILVGASHVEKDIEALAAAISSGDSDAIANAIGNLLNSWSQVTGGCKSDACAFINGLLRVIQEVASDIQPCESALAQVITQFESGAAQFDSADYKGAVATWASAFDATAMALKQETCGLQRIGDLIGKLSPKLANVVIKIEDSSAVRIILGSADLYDALFRAVKALKAKDYETFGNEIAVLLRLLRSSDCTTKACDVLEGVLASLQLELENVDSCVMSADNVWSDLQQAIQLFDDRAPVDGVKSLGSVFVELANTLQSCQITQLAQIAETMLNKMGDTTTATEIGEVVTILVNGADMTLEIQQSISDYKSKSYHAFGSDLASLADLISSSRCHSVGCQVVEGILHAEGLAFQDLEACEKDIKGAENGFVLGAQQFKLKQYKLGVQSFAQSLNIVAQAVTDCGLQQEMGFIIQEANVFGLANVTSALSNDINILVHGADLYQIVLKTVQDIEHHDWHSAGGDFQQVMSQLSQWTGKHACDSDFCYVVIGVLQFLGDIKGSIKECKADFEGAFQDFKYAAANFTDSHNGIWHMSHDKSAVRMGVHALGEGVLSISKGVGDCDIVEFAEILAKLAAKLGIEPEVSWLEEVLHILINGVKIEQEVETALVDWSNRNWPGFGYNVAMLIKTLL